MWDFPRFAFNFALVKPQTARYRDVLSPTIGYKSLRRLMGKMSPVGIIK